MAWRSVSTSGPGSVRNDSPLIAMSRSKRSACCAITARSQADSAAPVWSLLKRMFSIALADAGMTLVAGLPTSMLVNCRLDGWNQSLPASSGAAVSASAMRISRCTGLSARCG